MTFVDGVRARPRPGPKWFLWLSAAAGACTLLACSDQTELRGTAPSGESAIDGPDGLADVPTDLDWKDTSPAWHGAGDKLLLTGVVYGPDTRTPAAGVVLYYYHTNGDGRYIHEPGELRSMPPNSLGQTHGAIRGWVKTRADGRYAIYTARPGVYPTRDEPAHVHVTVKEPDRSEYYIDDFVFDDDPLLNSRKRLSLENRCGSGVLRLVEKDGVLVGERDIFLGQNIPGYRGDAGQVERRGMKIGEDVISFTPFHAWGPDKGTSTCPVCKYGWYHGAILFVGDNPDWEGTKKWLAFLESESVRRKDRFKAYLVYGNRKGYSRETRERELEAIGRELGLEHVALTFVPSLDDELSDIAFNRIDPSARNTLILYRRSRVIDVAVDIMPDAAAFRRVTERLDGTINEYFNLPK